MPMQFPSSSFVDVTLNTNQIKGLMKPEAFKNVANEDILDPITQALAFGSREYLSRLLSRGNAVSGVVVGASGASSKNLFVGKMAGTPFAPVAHFVYEGTVTKANKFIRTGTSGKMHVKKAVADADPDKYPRKSKGVKGIPPMQRIRLWISIKGPGNFAMNPGESIERLAWRIAVGIKKRGTSTAHKPLYPTNARRFDYVRYAVEKSPMLPRLYAELRTALPGAEETMVTYFRSGMRTKAGTWAKKMSKKII